MSTSESWIPAQKRTEKTSDRAGASACATGDVDTETGACARATGDADTETGAQTVQGAWVLVEWLGGLEFNL